MIILSEPKEYLIHSWKKKLTSYELRDDSAYNCALNPVIFGTAEEALEKAVSRSKEEEGAFPIVQ